MLWPRLQPLLSLRATGTGIVEGAVPANVVQEVFSRAEAALTTLIKHAGERLGLDARLIEHLRHLPAQRFAYGSFEVAFRAPEVSDDVDQEIIEHANAVFAKAAELLKSGIELSQVEATTEKEELGKDIDDRLAIFEAAKALSPSGRSQIEEIQISGTLTGRPPYRPALLNKYTYRSASESVKKIRKVERTHPPTQFRGWIRQVTDIKPYQFVLFQPDDESKVVFELDADNESLWADATDAIKHHREVIVVGKNKPKTSRFLATSILPVKV
jgi:hypothetical protein